MKDEKKVHRVALQVAAETPVLKPFNSSELRATKVRVVLWSVKNQGLGLRSCFRVLGLKMRVLQSRIGTAYPISQLKNLRG